MDTKYIKLFIELSHAAEILAEQVMDYNREHGDTDGEKTARVMRDDYANLYDKIRVERFDVNTLTMAEYAKLLVAALIVVNNIEMRITQQQKAIDGYKTDIIPKLQQIVNDCKTEEEIYTTAKKLFTINE